MRRVAMQLALIALTVPVAQADTVVLKNGAEFTGRIQQADKDPFYLKFSGGRISFRHSEVTEIRLDHAEFDPERWHIPSDEPGGSPTVGAVNSPGGTTLNPDELRRFRRLMLSLDEENEEGEDSGLNEKRQSLIRALGAFGPRAAPHLKRALEKGNPENTPYVLGALMAAAPRQGTKVARKMAEDHSDSRARATAISLLTEEDAHAHTDLFARAVKDSQGEVRLAALRGLAATEDVAQAPVLIEILDDPVSRVRDGALEALRMCTGKSFNTPSEWTAWYQETQSVAKADAASDPEASASSTEHGQSGR